MVVARQSQRGFTLVELLATLALGTLVSTTVFGSVLVQQRLLVAQLHNASAQQSGRVAFEILERYVAGAGWGLERAPGLAPIPVGACDRGAPFDCNGVDAGSDRVSLVRLEEDGEGALRPVATTFAIDRADPLNPVLVMTRTGEEASFVVAHDIDDLQLRYGIDLQAGSHEGIDLWCDDLRPEACPTGLATSADNAHHVRAVDVAVVSRSRAPRLSDASSLAVHDHVLAADGYRRWVFQVVVSLRNAR